MKWSDLEFPWPIASLNKIKCILHWKHTEIPEVSGVSDCLLWSFVQVGWQVQSSWFVGRHLGVRWNLQADCGHLRNHLLWHRVRWNPYVWLKRNNDISVIASCHRAWSWKTAQGGGYCPVMKLLTDASQHCNIMNVALHVSWCVEKSLVFNLFSLLKSYLLWKKDTSKKVGSCCDIRKKVIQGRSVD